MRQKCIEAVNRAAGRTLSANEINGIDTKLNETMTRLARKDPQAWMAMPADQRVLTAATQAMADIKAAAGRKLANVQRQVLRTAELEGRLDDSQARMGWGRAKALAEDYQGTADRADGVKRDFVRHLQDLIDAARDGQGAGIGKRLSMFLFDAENPAMTRDLALEIFARGKAGTDNGIAKDGAAAWLQVAQAARERFNAAGGDLRGLRYGYLPNAWEKELVLKAGYDKFASDVLPELDRRRYVHADGRPMNDQEVYDLLRTSGESIATDGAADASPGAFRGPGAKANKGHEVREIHFKDGEAYLRVMEQYGSGSMYEAMLSHLGGISRDIALIERYGPNPEAQHRLQVDLAKQADNGGKLVFGASLDAHWRNLTGAASSAAEWRLDLPLMGEMTGAGTARTLGAVRNLHVASKLGSAVISSLTDIPTFFATSHYNKLDYFEALGNLRRFANPLERTAAMEFMGAHGLMAESLMQSLDRFSGDYLSASMTGRLAHTTMKLSLMNAWTDWLRNSYRMTHMQALGRMVSKEWGSLSEWDRMLMINRSINEADWEVMRSAEITPTRWGDMLTPDGIYATGNPKAADVVAKVLGLLSRESEYAVIDPDLATRAFLNRGFQRGTVEGEIARSIAQFKAFPTALVSRHWRRMLETPAGLEGAPAGYGLTPGSRTAFGSALVVSSTVAGAIAFQAKQVRDGKDPADMTTKKFWIKALGQGGGLSFIGDVLLRDSTDDRAPQQGLFELLGPSASSAAQLFELTKGNVDEALAGKDTHAGAEAVQFAKGHVPFVNLWYGKAALDHMMLNAIQENMSPGYLQRVKARAAKDWNSSWWWKPEDAAPARAPDLTTAGGR
jgi:hypothetical protein